MKKLILFATLLLVASLFVNAQQKNERYCKVYVISHLSNERAGGYIVYETIKVDLGKSELITDMAIDSSEVYKIQSISNFKSDIDAINYMNKIGWELVTIISYRPMFLNELGRKEIYFKKAFK